MSRSLLALLALASGVGGLAYEVLYFRHLTTLLGDLFYVHAALLAVFLAGIGLGARWARLFLPRLYLIECAIGAYALVLPLLTRAFPFAAAGDLIPDYALRVSVLTVLFLAIPSVAIGFSVPLFSAYVKQARGGAPSFAGVYLLYNAGAALGVLVLELVVIRHLGITSTLRLTGMLNLGIGLLLATAYRPLARSLPAAAVSSAPFPAGVLAALALSSFGSAIYQMFYAKLCSHVFGPHRQVFALCLVMALLGVALGSWLVRARRMTFGGAVAGGLLGAVLPLAAFRPLQEYFWRITEPGLVSLHPWLAWCPAAAFGLLLGLAAFTAWGGTVPALLLREDAVERDAGLLLCVSCLANAAGFLFYVFWGQPLLRFFDILLVLAALSAAAVALAEGRRGLRAQRWVLLAALPALLLAVRTDESHVFLGRWMRDVTPETKIVHYKHGPDNVSYVDRQGDSAIRYNGHPSITVRKAGRLNQAEILSGILPALGAPRRERAMVLGMGTGLTGGTVARLFDHTDVVEINQAFFSFCRDMPDVNFDLMRNPAARVVYDDGRIHLSAQHGIYDVVVNSIPAPTYFSAGKIYTKEFYEMVRRALKPDGIFCTWLSAGDFTEEGVAVVARTIRESFAYYSLWIMRDEYVFLLCSNQGVPEIADPARLDFPADIADFWGKEYPVLPPADLQEAACISRGRLDQLAVGDGAVNRDDFPVLEFMVTSLFPRRPSGSGTALARMFPLMVPAPGDRTPAQVGRYALHARLHYPPLFQGYYATVLMQGRERMEAYADAAYGLFAVADRGLRFYQAELDVLVEACELNTQLGRRAQAVDGWQRLLRMQPGDPYLRESLTRAEAL